MYFEIRYAHAQLSIKWITRYVLVLWFKGHKDDFQDTEEEKDDQINDFYFNFGFSF